MPPRDYARLRDLMTAAGLPRRIAELRAHAAVRRGSLHEQRTGGPDRPRVNTPDRGPGRTDPGAGREPRPANILAESSDYLSRSHGLDASLVPARGSHAFDGYSSALAGGLDPVAVRALAAQRSRDASALVRALEAASDTPDTLEAVRRPADRLDDGRDRRVRTGFAEDLHERGYGGVWDESLHPRGDGGRFAESAEGPRSVAEKPAGKKPRWTPEQVERIAEHGRNLARKYWEERRARDAAKRGDAKEGTADERAAAEDGPERVTDSVNAPAETPTRPDASGTPTGVEKPAPAAEADPLADVIARRRAEAGDPAALDRAADEEEAAAELSTTGRATPASRAAALDRATAAVEAAQAAGSAPDAGPSLPGLDPAERGSVGVPAVDGPLDAEAERQARRENGEPVPPPEPDTGISADPDVPSDRPDPASAPVTTGPSADAPATPPPGTVPGSPGTDASQTPAALSPEAPEAPTPAAEAPPPSPDERKTPAARSRATAAAGQRDAAAAGATLAAVGRQVGNAALSAAAAIGRQIVAGPAISPIVPLAQTLVKRKIFPLVAESVDRGAALSRIRSVLDEAAKSGDCGAERIVKRARDGKSLVKYSTMEDLAANPKGTDR